MNSDPIDDLLVRLLRIRSQLGIRVFERAITGARAALARAAHEEAERRAGRRGAGAAVGKVIVFPLRRARRRLPDKT